jgi:bacterioferritin-associated ferredoxin
MYVCLCSGVTDGQIRSRVAEGPCSMKDLRDCLGVAKQCGRCAPYAKSLLREAVATSNPGPRLAAAA